MRTSDRGKRVRELRQHHGWSQADLARRLTKAGMPLQQSDVARLEAGQRGISADDLETLAFVLSVAPAALMCGDRGTTVGGKRVSAADYAAWFTGRRPLESVADKGLYIGYGHGFTLPGESHLGGVLRSIADQYDLTDEDEKRDALMWEVVRQASYDPVNRRQVARVKARRATGKGGDDGAR